MKKMIALMMVLGCAGALVAAESAAIRVDTRMGLFGGKMATGVEAVGEPDGSLSSSWVTTNTLWDGSQEFPDGWYVRQDDGTGLQDWFALGAEDTDGICAACTLALPLIRLLYRLEGKAKSS